MSSPDGLQNVLYWPVTTGVSRSQFLIWGQILLYSTGWEFQAVFWHWNKEKKFSNHTAFRCYHCSAICSKKVFKATAVRCYYLLLFASCEKAAAEQTDHQNQEEEEHRSLINYAGPQWKNEKLDKKLLVIDCCWLNTDFPVPVDRTKHQTSVRNGKSTFVCSVPTKLDKGRTLSLINISWKTAEKSRFAL